MRVLEIETGVVQAIGLACNSTGDSVPIDSPPWGSSCMGIGVGISVGIDTSSRSGSDGWVSEQRCEDGQTA